MAGSALGRSSRWRMRRSIQADAKRLEIAAEVDLVADREAIVGDERDAGLEPPGFIVAWNHNSDR